MSSQSQQPHLPARIESLSVVHRQLSQAFELEESQSAASVSEAAESQADSIEVCTCLCLFLFRTSCSAPLGQVPCAVPLH